MGFAPPRDKPKILEPALSFDLETGGTLPGCVILSIGAVIFDERAKPSHDEVFPTFYRNTCCDELPLEWDPATRDWWSRQSDAAKEALKVDVVPFDLAMDEFLAWIGRYNPHSYWCCSPSFDMVILRHALNAADKEWPLHFSVERDVRTLRNLAFRNKTNAELPKLTHGLAHNALDDSAAQARLVQICYTILGLNRENA